MERDRERGVESEPPGDQGAAVSLSCARACAPVCAYGRAAARACGCFLFVVHSFFLLSRACGGGNFRIGSFTRTTSLPPVFKISLTNTHTHTHTHTHIAHAHAGPQGRARALARTLRNHTYTNTHTHTRRGGNRVSDNKNMKKKTKPLSQPTSLLSPLSLSSFTRSPAPGARPGPPCPACRAGRGSPPSRIRPCWCPARRRCRWGRRPSTAPHTPGRCPCS